MFQTTLIHSQVPSSFTVTSDPLWLSLSMLQIHTSTQGSLILSQQMGHPQYLELECDAIKVWRQMQLKCWQYLPLTGTLILSLVQGQTKQTLLAATQMSALLLVSSFIDSAFSILLSLKVWVYRSAGVILSTELTAMQQTFLSSCWYFEVNLALSRQGILNRMKFLPAFNLSLGTVKYSSLLCFLLELQSKGLSSKKLVFQSLMQQAPCIGQVKNVFSGTKPRTSTGQPRSSWPRVNSKLKILMYSKIENVLKQLSTRTFLT